MNRHELASYLASIITILNDFDDNGVQQRPVWLTTEYTRAYNELKEMVTDETGKSE